MGRGNRDCKSSVTEEENSVSPGSKEEGVLDDATEQNIYNTATCYGFTPNIC